MNNVIDEKSKKFAIRIINYINTCVMKRKNILYQNKF